MAALAIDIAGIAARPGSAPVLRGKLNDLQARVVAAADETRQIAYRMHPSILDDLGLIPSLKDLCADFSRRHRETVFEFRGVPPRTRISANISVSVYRIAQQCLQNIVEHAQAKRASVEITSRHGALRLTVTDNGKGFDPERIRGGGGLGFVSMQERAKLAGGTLEVFSRPRRGTEIVLNVPPETGPVSEIRATSEDPLREDPVREE
jgi:signal transduction histidine kinase